MRRQESIILFVLVVVYILGFVYFMSPRNSESHPSLSLEDFHGGAKAGLRGGHGRDSISGLPSEDSDQHSTAEDP